MSLFCACVFGVSGDRPLISIHIRTIYSLVDPFLTRIRYWISYLYINLRRFPCCVLKIINAKLTLFAERPNTVSSIDWLIFVLIDHDDDGFNLSCWRYDDDDDGWWDRRWNYFPAVYRFVNEPLPYFFELQNKNASSPGIYISIYFINDNLISRILLTTHTKFFLR